MLPTGNRDVITQPEPKSCDTVTPRFAMDSLVKACDAPGLASLVVKQLEPEAAAKYSIDILFILKKLRFVRNMSNHIVNIQIFSHIQKFPQNLRGTLKVTNYSLLIAFLILNILKNSCFKQIVLRLFRMATLVFCISAQFETSACL